MICVSEHSSFKASRSADFAVPGDTNLWATSIQQDEVELLLAAFPAVDVFVAHNSPRLIHERDEDVHVGFAALNSYLLRARPRFLLHGHQHVNAETKTEGTRVIGVYGHRFLVIREPAQHDSVRP